MERSEINRLFDRLEKLSCDVDTITQHTHDMDVRVRDLQLQKGKGDTTEPQAPNPNEAQSQGLPAGTGHGHGAPVQALGAGAVGGLDTGIMQYNSPTTYENIQQEFMVIKDTLQRVRLPNELKVNDTSSGVRREDQARAKVVSRCARYSETLVKLLASIQPDSVSPGDLQDILTVCVAQVRFLQEEQAMMMVSGQYGPRVEKSYRNLRSNTSAFTPAALETLQAAVVLEGHAGPDHSRGTPRGGFAGRWNSRGNYRGNYRGSYHNQMQNRSRVPPQRTDQAPSAPADN